MATVNNSDLEYPSLHALICTLAYFISWLPLLWFKKWLLGIMFQSSEHCGCPSLLCEPTVWFTPPDASLIHTGRQALPSWFLIEKHLVALHSLTSLKSMFPSRYKMDWFPVSGSPGPIVLPTRQQLAHEQTLDCAHHKSHHSLQQLPVGWLLLNPQVKLTQSKHNMQTTLVLSRIFDGWELP